MFVKELKPVLLGACASRSVKPEVVSAHGYSSTDTGAVVSKLEVGHWYHYLDTVGHIASDSRTGSLQQCIC